MKPKWLLEGRSPKWPALRKKFLKGKTCGACGGKKSLEAHHVIPVHIDPEKELDIDNLLALCEGNKNINCHLVIGHSFNYRGWNPDTRQDAAQLLARKKENEGRRIDGIQNR